MSWTGFNWTGVDQGWRVDQHPRFFADVTGDGWRRAGRRHRGPEYAADCRPGLGKVDALTYPAADQAWLPRSPTGVRLVIDTRPQVAGRG